jgi:tellurite resistance protein TerC
VQVSSWWWFGTLGAVVALLTIDLVVTGRAKRPPTPREAALGAAFYVAMALIFAFTLFLGFGSVYSGEFLAGWLTEYSLSVDNLFVFIVLMARFSVPDELQLRVLTIGILLALFLRGLLIGAGAAALHAFSWVFYLFGAFLLWTAVGLVREALAEKKQLELSEPEPPSLPIRILERLIPSTREWHGGKVFTTVAGRRVMTPMAITMVAIGITDVMFAFDSIPAIFGLTQEAFLVVSANAFALMGLRQLYFLVGGVLDRLIYLGQGLALILAFIAVKLVLEALHTNELGFINGGRPVGWVPEISTTTSLIVVTTILVVTAAASLIRTGIRPMRPAAGQREPVRARVSQPQQGE